MTNKFSLGDKGVTLIELLITFIIASLIIGAAIALHLANQRIFTKDESLIELRNNVRGALDIIISDLRSAGFNPTQAPTPEFDPAVRDAREDWVFVRMDTNENGICEYGEERGYHDYGSSLYRYLAVTPTPDTQLIAENIDYLGFRYFNAVGDTIPTPVDATQLENIRAIRIIIVGKTPREFSNYSESGTYPDGTPYNDRCYRCWDSTYVRLRNI